jgi:hypothetical protein
LAQHNRQIDATLGDGDLVCAHRDAAATDTPVAIQVELGCPDRQAGHARSTMRRPPTLEDALAPNAATRLSLCFHVLFYPLRPASARNDCTQSVPRAIMFMGLATLAGVHLGKEPI